MVLTVLTLPGSSVEKVDVSGLVKLHHRSYDLLPFLQCTESEICTFLSANPDVRIRDRTVADAERDCDDGVPLLWGIVQILHYCLLT